MKKSGFTLIELLAVIVILAIIALIATPIILGVVEDAKKSAAVSSTYGYNEAIVKENAIRQFNGGVGFSDGVYEVPITDLKISGKAPSSGWVVLKDGDIENYAYKIDSFVVTKDANGKAVVAKTNTLPEKPGGNVDESIYGKVIALFPQLELGTNGCKTSGENNYTYQKGCYLKGKVDNNWISFSNYNWRIMGINSDKSIRMITSDVVGETEWLTIPDKYAPSYDGSNLETYLNNTFKNKMVSSDLKYIVNSEWCSNFFQYNQSEYHSCTNIWGVNPALIGTITANEYILSGESNSYLSIGKSFFTTSFYNSGNTEYYVNVVKSEGNLDIFLDESPQQVYPNGIRPIVNILNSTIVKSGNGTQANPFKF